MAVENAPAHERIWIEDIYQHIFCGASQGVRKQADGMVAVWRKMFAPPPAPTELMGLGGHELQPQRTCGNGEVIKIDRAAPAGKPPSAEMPPTADSEAIEGGTRGFGLKK
jgi:hypothetical protein